MPAHTKGAIDHVEVLLGLSEGTIDGLIEGKKSFYFGDTPFQNQDGHDNFDQASITMYPGDPSPPDIVLKLGGSASNMPINTNMENDVIIVRTTGNTTGLVNALDIRIVVTDLSFAATEGPKGANLYFKMEYKRSDSGTWLDFAGGQQHVYALITTPSPFEYRQAITPWQGTWDIRVTKNSSPDDDKHHHTCQWESYQEIIIGPLNFPYTACAVVEVQASNQFSSVPDMWGLYHGIKCRVPDNYNTDTRVYTGSWGGIFKTAWTDDNVWILHELIGNNRWGMAAYFPVATDVYDFYDASVYISTQVPDGSGGTMPRFSYNRVISDPEMGDTLVNEVAGSFFGICIPDGNGTYILRLDRDEDPVALFTPEMVSEGLFTYSYSDMEQRYNKITAKFPNPTIKWNEDKRVVEDTADQAINGIVPLELILPNVTNFQEAMRSAKMRQLSSLTETESVMFKTNRMARVVDIFDVILIADPDMNYALTRRILSISQDRKTINFRDQMGLESGITYTANFQTTAGLLSKNFNLNSSGAYYSITFGSPIDNAVVVPNAFSVGAVGTVGLPKPYRVLNVTVESGDEDNQTILATEVNRAKYNLVDNMDYEGNNGPLHWRNNKSDTYVPPPTELTLSNQNRTVLGKTHNILRFSFTPSAITVSSGPVNNNFVERPVKPRISRYRVEYAYNGRLPVFLTETVNPAFEVEDPLAGDYTFYVYALNDIGCVSDAVTYDYTVDAATSSLPIPDISGLEIENQGTDTVFTSEDVKFTWRITATGLVAYDLDDEEIIAGTESFTNDSTFKEFHLKFIDVDTGETFFTDHTKEFHYRFTYAQNRKTDGGPRRTFKLGVTYRNKSGLNGKTAYLTVSNPAPAVVTNLRAEVGPGTVKFMWDASPDPDVMGYKLWLTTVPGGVSDDTDLFYKGKENSFIYTVAPGAVVYIKVAAYDGFDNTVNQSDWLSVTIPKIGAGYIDDRAIQPKNLARDYDAWTPSAPGSHTILDNKIGLLIVLGAPSASALVVVMPPNPIDGQLTTITTNQALSTVTISPNTGQTIAGTPPTTLGPDAPVSYMYSLPNTLWFRV